MLVGGLPVGRSVSPNVLIDEMNILQIRSWDSTYRFAGISALNRFKKGCSIAESFGFIQSEVKQMKARERELNTYTCIYIFLPEQLIML